MVDRQRQRLGLKSVPTTYALRLDGVSGYVQTNPNIININNNHSGYIHIKPFNVDSDYARYLVISNIYLMNSNSNGWLIVQYWNGTQNVGLDSGGVVIYNNIETRICWTFEVGNELILYVNGNIVSSSSPATRPENETIYLTIVGWANPDFYVKGLVYEVAGFASKISITNAKALTTGNIKADTLSNCKFYHDYTLGHAQDLSGNGNDGTLMGNAFFEPQSQFQ